MFDAFSPSADSSAAALDADDEGSDTVPTEPDWPEPTAEDEAAWYAAGAAANEPELALMDPVERFEQEYGYPPTPDSPELAAMSREMAAVLAQEAAVQANQIRTLADARRIAALLNAFEASLIDLGARFGRSFGEPHGMGAQAFYRSFGLLTKTHPNHVAAEVGAARTLRDQLPATWAVFQAGNASWNRVRTAVTQADGLDPNLWPTYDTTAARLVVTSNRLKDDLRKMRERLQDDTASARARATHARRRTSLELGHNSGVALVIEGLAIDWVPINDALHRAAVTAHGTDPQGRSLAVLRHDIALDILENGLRDYAAAAADGGDVRVPDRKPVDVTLILTVPALAWLGVTAEQAQLGGYGPIDLETAKSLAGSAKSFIRVLTHPFTGTRLAMDRTTYSPPADLARWVRIRDGRSRFPGSTRPAHLCDIDHAREWQHGGTTDADNLITLDRSTHNLKTAGLLNEELLDTGIVGWTDAWKRSFEDQPDNPHDPAPPHLLPPSNENDDGGGCPF